MHLKHQTGGLYNTYKNKLLHCVITINKYKLHTQCRYGPYTLLDGITINSTIQCAVFQKCIFNFYIYIQNNKKHTHKHAQQNQMKYNTNCMCFLCSTQMLSPRRHPFGINNGHNMKFITLSIQNYILKIIYVMQNHYIVEHGRLPELGIYYTRNKI